MQLVCLSQINAVEIRNHLNIKLSRRAKVGQIQRTDKRIRDNFDNHN